MRIINETAHGTNFGGMRGKIEYIVIHYTGNAGDTARGNANYFKRPNLEASAHYFVDENEIYQSVPDMYEAWSVGRRKYPSTIGGHWYGRCTNANSISIELCNSLNSVPAATAKLAGELVRELMNKYNIPAENIIRHYDVTGKICPAPLINAKKWEQFKEGLLVERYQKISDLPAWAQADIQELVDRGAIADGNNLDLSMDMLRTIIIMKRLLK